MKTTDLEQVARACWSHCTHGTPGFACQACIAAAFRRVVRQAAESAGPRKWRVLAAFNMNEGS